MSKRKYEIAIHVLNAIALSAFLIMFINLSYPDIGHDYTYYIPRLLDTYLHYKINGLSIQWYTPSFGGGLPAYPSPQHMQFSLPQLLTPVLNPWGASVAATVIFALSGYFAMYYFLTRGLLLRWQAGVLGGLFFSVNGFFFQHVAAGHLGFQTFPLLAVIIVALFAASLPEIISAIIIALVVAGMVHEAGFYILVISLLSLLITIPAVYLHYPNIFKFKRFFRVATYGLIFSISLSASKLFAVYSWMRFFPRTMYDQYDVSLLRGIVGLIYQLLGTMNLVPLRWLLGTDINLVPLSLQNWTGSFYGYWETDVSLSPVLIGLLCLGAISRLIPRKNDEKIKPGKRRWIAIVLLTLAIWTTAEFTLARGSIYTLLKNLPALSSLHVNFRFAAAFIFPLALLGAISYEKITSKWARQKALIFFLILDVLVLAFQGTYFLFKEDVQDRAYTVSTALETFHRIQAGDTFPVNKIADVSEVFWSNASSLIPYEVVFGYELEEFKPQFVAGPVNMVRDGYFNMTNPAGYVFPEENHTTAFERIPATEADKLEAFTHRRQPDWKRPQTQHILDATSLVSLIVFSSLLGGLLVRGMIRKFAIRR